MPADHLLLECSNWVRNCSHSARLEEDGSGTITLFGLTSSTAKVHQAMKNEQISTRSDESSDRSCIDFPEQRSVSWMQGSTVNFTNRDLLIGHPCAGAVSTGKPCMTFSKHRLFIGCSSHPVLFNASISEVVKKSAGPVVNRESDSTGSTAAVEARRSYFTAMHGMNRNENTGFC